MQKFGATFDSYWNSSEFETYDPDRDRDRLDDALNEAAGRRGDRVTISISGLQVRPFPYQQEMLDAIEVDAVVHDRHRNLVVAATGTGKTVIAALDYRRLAEGQSDSRRCSLSRIARRSWSSRSGPIRRCSPTPTSASSTSARQGQSDGSTSSRACSRCTSYGVQTSRRMHSTSS